jgi:hypothetical protein
MHSHVIALGYTIAVDVQQDALSGGTQRSVFALQRPGMVKHCEK